METAGPGRWTVVKFRFKNTSDRKGNRRPIGAGRIEMQETDDQGERSPWRTITDAIPPGECREVDIPVASGARPTAATRIRHPDANDSVLTTATPPATAVYAEGYYYTSGGQERLKIELHAHQIPTNDPACP